MSSKSSTMGLSWRRSEDCAERRGPDTSVADDATSVCGPSKRRRHGACAPGADGNDSGLAARSTGIEDDGKGGGRADAGIGDIPGPLPR